MQECHPERSAGSLAGQRSFAALRMTKRDGLLCEMYCPQGPGDKLATSAIIEKTNTPLLGMYLAPRSDEPGTTLERRQVHQPLEPDHQAVAKADQAHEMQDQPHDPS